MKGASRLVYVKGFASRPPQGSNDSLPTRCFLPTLTFVLTMKAWASYLDDHELYPSSTPSSVVPQDNRIAASTDYRVPSTSSVFKIAGPAGFETVYWLVTPAAVNEPKPRMPAMPSTSPSKPITLTPRCDDAVLKARGDCIDNSAGLKLVPRGVELPQALAQAAGETRRDLLFMRQQDKAVISSPDPLTGPVIYEFRLAHK